MSAAGLFNNLFNAYVLEYALSSYCTAAQHQLSVSILRHPIRIRGRSTGFNYSAHQLNFAPVLLLVDATFILDFTIHLLVTIGTISNSRTNLPYDLGPLQRII